MSPRVGSIIMRHLYPNEKTDIKNKISLDNIQEHIEYGFYPDNFNINIINRDTVYTFTKKHFLGNVGFDYEYFCEELNMWFFDSDLERRPT